MDSLIYLSKAQKAYDSGDYKLCIVLMRRTALRKPDEIQLFVNAVYFGWKYGKSNLSLSEIQEAYSVLFKSTEGANIPPYEFVRLSHIYIKTGNLVGAMKTLQYAAFCDHLSSAIVLLQTWTLLRKLESREDPRKYMTYLCDIIPMETPEEDEQGLMLLRGTDIPIYMVFLHCAVHLHNEVLASKSRDLRAQYKHRQTALIAEAYTHKYHHHPQSTAHSYYWYDNYETWTEMGDFLRNTPCILLAEESYFVAYTCSPLSDKLIDPCIDILDVHNRPNEKFSFLEKAYRFNHWNMNCRKRLLEYDQKGHYSQLFAMQHAKARMIQAAFRGYFTRAHWEALYNKMKVIKAEYYRRIERAHKLRKAALQRHFRYRVRTWKENAAFMKRLRFYSAQAIQMKWRCLQAKRLVKAIIKKRVAANRKYLMACEIHHNMSLMQILGEWNKIFFQVRNDNRATLIATFLKKNKTQAKLKWAANKLTKLLNIRRKFNTPKLFKRWRALFVKRRIVHARTTIRFFIRACLLRVKKKKIEMKLKRVARSTTGLGPISIDKIVRNLNKIDQKKHWIMWKQAMLIRKREAAQILLARRLPVIHRQKQLRQSLNRLRAIREFIRGHITKRITVRRTTHFRKWRVLWAVLIIQRRIRIFLAQCRLQRRMYQLQRADYLHHRTWKRIMGHRFQKMKWCVRLAKFRVRCMANRIVRWYRRCMLNGRLVRFCKRKYGLYVFLHLVHMKYLRKAFGQLNRQIFAGVKIQAVGKLVKSFNHALHRFAFARFAQCCNEQKKIHQIVGLRVKKRLQRSIFTPVNTKGWTYSSVTGYTGHNMSMMNWNTGRKVEMSPYWPYLLNKPADNILLDIATAKKVIVFQTWKMLFRLRTMTKINCAAEAVPSVLKDIVPNFRTKVKCCVMVQCLFRRNKANARLREKKLHRYIFCEREDKVFGKKDYYFRRRVFRAGLEVVQLRQNARLRLQCWFRVLKARKLARRRRAIVTGMNSWEVTIRKRAELSALREMMRLMEFGCALRSCEVRQSSPRELKIQFGAKNSDIEAIFRKVDRMKKGSLKDFASDEYHSHIFRLRQSGVLIIDSSSTMLRQNELSFLIQNARTIFSQSAGEHSNVIRDVTRYFLGDKLIFCGGTISDTGARELFYLLSKREDPIALHLSEVMMPYKGIARLARAISLNFAKMREFSVDSVSVGSLGLATLIVAIKDNRTVSSMSIKLNSDGVVLPCYGECFQSIVRNSFLKELRIFGSAVTSEVLRGLCYAVKYGLSALHTLEFDYLTADKTFVFELMALCSQREGKRTGSTVTVRANEFTPKDVREELVMRAKRENIL